ncbi:MAG: hypothetical protein GY765_39045, partial [bacterium]|nr:hypothetical protein [bacterium]
ERAKFCDVPEETRRHISFLYDLKDIYPFLPLADLLITDYSSIYFDYLLLDRPIVFFPYDLETYINEERGLIFEYDRLTPGPHCFSREELEKEVFTALVDLKDSYKEKREEIGKLAFTYRDGKSCQRVWRDIIEERLIQ